jgi:hypothetical protein
MRPVQAPDAYDLSTVGYQFHFDYIMPAHPDAVPYMNQLSGGKIPPEKIPAAGPAPVLIRYTVGRLARSQAQEAPSCPGPPLARLLLASLSPACALGCVQDLKRVTPEWERVTAAIEADPKAVKQLDWVREMYAWDIAVALNNVELKVEEPPHSHLIAQPPHDLVLGDAAMCHYTWGTLYFEHYTNGSRKEIWR